MPKYEPHRKHTSRITGDVRCSCGQYYCEDERFPFILTVPLPNEDIVADYQASITLIRTALEKLDRLDGQINSFLLRDSPSVTIEAEFIESLRILTVGIPPHHVLTHLLRGWEQVAYTYGLEALVDHEINCYVVNFAGDDFTEDTDGQVGMNDDELLTEAATHLYTMDLGLSPSQRSMSALDFMRLGAILLDRGRIDSREASATGSGDQS